MDDKKIIELYFARNQRAISETDRKYGQLCKKVSFAILSNYEDVEECVSDTYMAAWQAIPPKMPNYLGAWLAKISRNLSLMRLREKYSVKRGGGEMTLVLEELGDTFPAGDRVEQLYERKELAQAISSFLRNLEDEERNIFVFRYWFMIPVSQIADKLQCSQSKVKTSLFRTRKKLKAYLMQEELI